MRREETNAKECKDKRNKQKCPEAVDIALLPCNQKRIVISQTLTPQASY